MWKWMGLLLRKNHILRCWGWASFHNWIGALTFSLLLKLLPRKFEFYEELKFYETSTKFIFPEVTPYLYKSTIRPCMWYCCHVWAGAPNCYLELLDKLKKQTCRTAGPSLAVCLKPFTHCRNVASLSLLYRYYFIRCSPKLA